MICPSCGATNEPGAEVCFSCRRVLGAVSKGTVLASRYEILEFLGRGGMGTVYRARDLVLDEEIAIKVLRADVASSPGMAERFLSEIKLARRVSHPNVCRIHEYGEDGVLRFISMELVKGRSLKDVLAAGPLAAPRAFDAAEQAARGLAAIHEVGIVHRDLKPANLTVDEGGRVRVMDFGIAKTAGMAGDTTAGYLLGSPEYMSPEQARGRGADFRSDLYSLGAVVFELFVGQPPFRAETPVGTLLLQIETPPPLDRHPERIPPPLVPVLSRALAKVPKDRYGSALELAEALRTAAGSAPALPRPAAARSERPSSRRASRRWGIVALAPILAALSAVWISRSPSRGDGSRSGAPLPSPSFTPQAAPSAAPLPTVTATPTAPPLPPPDRHEAPRKARPSPTSPPAARAAEGEGATPPAAPASDRPAPASAAAIVPATPTPSPPEATQAPGFLLVVVSPWADVAVDGRSVGQTPLGRIPLPPGPHTVRLSHPMFQPYPRKVTVRSGETTRLTVDLAQDGVRIQP